MSALSVPIILYAAKKDVPDIKNTFEHRLLLKMFFFMSSNIEIITERSLNSMVWG